MVQKKMSFQSADTEASPKLKKGIKVEVIKKFRTDEPKDPANVRVGTLGEVVQIDAHGNARIKFKGKDDEGYHYGECWVYQNKLGHMKVVKPKCSNTDGTKESTHFPCKCGTNTCDDAKWPADKACVAKVNKCLPKSCPPSYEWKTDWSGQGSCQWIADPYGKKESNELCSHDSECQSNVCAAQYCT